MRAIDTANHTPVTLHADATIGEAAQLMDSEGVGAVVVVDAADRPIGIVTDRDIAVRAVARGVTPDGRLDHVMSTDLVTAPPEADIQQVLALLRTHRFRRVPIVENDRMIAMVTVDDLLLRTFDDLSDLLLPLTKQTLHAEPQPGVPTSA